MQLNPEQQSAVEYNQGPLLIIAGAGTGKTRVITEKILHLIQNLGVSPSEILALTFTEKAAQEMIERVDLSMPLGYEELCIKTFHSFAEGILRESGLEIGLDPGYQILSDVNQWLFFKEKIFEFDLDYYRPSGNPNRFIYSLLGHFSKLKDELITPEEYLKYAENLKNEVENASVVEKKTTENDQKNKNNKESKKSKTSKEEFLKTLELAKAYQQYQQLMLANNSLDFGDLCYYANQLLEKRASVLTKYQNRFKYILVDEFQDTNYAQLQIVLKLVGENSKLTVVGDDDQSIYKWRGASLSNILKFEEYFPGAKQIVLTENYRSSKEILDTSYNLIQNNNPDRLEIKLGIDKKLRSNNPQENSKVEVHKFSDFISESEFVAKKIKEIVEKESKQPLSYKDFAILIRANNLAHPFIEELKNQGLPYQVKSPKGLIGLEEIKDLIAIARIIANPTEEIPLLRILKLPIFQVSMEDILKLLNPPRNSEISANSSLFYKLQKKALQEKEENLLPGMESDLSKIYELLKHLVEYSKSHSIGQVFNEFLQTSGYLKNLINQEQYDALENINQFAKQVARFEKENEENSARDFIKYLDLLEEANSVFAPEAIPDRDSVQILTIHSSKGLEFEYVFLVNTVNGRFPSRKRSDPFQIPEELTKEIFPEGDFHEQEERRLFYVATTRARQKLMLTFSEQYEGTKKWKISKFVQEILESEENNQSENSEENKIVELIEHETETDIFKKLQEFKEPKKPKFNLPSFNKKRISFSQFDTFKTCPLKYNYRYLMKVPSKESFVLNFGSSMHNTLNDFYLFLRKYSTSESIKTQIKNRNISFNNLEQLLEKNWISYGYESREHEAELKEKGRQMLLNFYQKEFGDKNSITGDGSNSDELKNSIITLPYFLEKPFNLKIGDHWISGRIDRIDKLADGSYELIDYKTGNPKDQKHADKSLQLSLYALAARDVLKIPVSKLSFYYLENCQKISTTRDQADLEALESEIQNLITEIQNSDFPPTPGFQCSFCDYRMICPAV